MRFCFKTDWFCPATVKKRIKCEIETPVENLFWLEPCDYADDIGFQLTCVTYKYIAIVVSAEPTLYYNLHQMRYATMDSLQSLRHTMSKSQKNKVIHPISLINVPNLDQISFASTTRATVLGTRYKRKRNLNENKSE